MNLVEALEAFRSRRSATLAAFIEHLGAEALLEFVPPKARTNVAFHAAWLEAAKNPKARTWCLRTLTQQLYPPDDKPRTFMQRVELLYSLDPDPRIARAMIELFELSPPVIGFVPVWELMKRALRVHAHDGTFEQAKRLRALDLNDEGFPRNVVVSEAERRAWAFVARSTTDVDALWKAVWATPDDDAAREVLADALQEQGDARGEFTSLQLRAARGEATEAELVRIHELLKAWGKLWLGRLRSVTKRAHFRRGCVSQLELEGRWSETHWAHEVSDPHLQTVEVLHPGSASAVMHARFLSSPLMTNLRVVTIESDEAMDALLERVPPLLARVICRRDQRSAQRFRERVLPFIEKTSSVVGIGCRCEDVKSWSTSLGQRLTHFECDDEWAQAIEVFRAYPRLISVRRGVEELVREPGHEVVLRIHAHGVRGLTKLPTTLEALPAEASRIEVIGNAALASRLQKTDPSRTVHDLPAPFLVLAV